MLFGKKSTPTPNPISLTTLSFGNGRIEISLEWNDIVTAGNAELITEACRGLTTFL
jgi:hypothetical protein